MANATPLTGELAYLIAQANRQMTRTLDAALGAEGVPVERWRVLRALIESDGMAMGDLAERVLMNHPTLTKLIDRMASDALVHRTADPADRRRVLVHASDRGRALAARVDALARSSQSEIEARCGGPETAALKRLLGGLIAETR